VTANFDRVRPREPRPTGTSGTSHDPQGKRALFSAASPGGNRPGVGSVTIECSGCGERTVTGVGQAVRAALPSLLLGVTVVRGERAQAVGVTSREHAAWLRCPACHRRRWVRLSVAV
jgi:hypothetical protein